MIADNGSLENVVGKLVEECRGYTQNVAGTDKVCEVCGVEEWAKYIDSADVAIVRYTGSCHNGENHTIECVEIDVELTFETVLKDKWKETCPDCNRQWSLGDLDVQNSKEVSTYRIGVQQVKKTRFEEHHTSYIPEKTIPLCGSCHTKVHNKNGFHDELKPDISRGKFEEVKND